MSNQGAAAQLCMDSALPIDASSEAFEFLTCTLKKMETIIHSNGIRGTRQQNVDRMRISQHQAGGVITMNPTTTELDRLWPRILGGTTAGGVTTLAETLPEFFICVDKVDDVATYEECVVSTATFSGDVGGPIELALTIEAKQEDMAETATFPTLTYDTEDQFILADCTLTVAGSPREFSRFTLTIDNVVDAGRFMNSLYRDQKPSQDCIVTLDMEFPSENNTDLIADGADGVDLTFVITDGTTTYTFTTGKAVCQPVSEEISGKSEIMLPLTYGLYKSGSTAQLTVTKT